MIGHQGILQNPDIRLDEKELAKIFLYRYANG